MSATDLFFTIAALGRPKELRDFLALPMHKELVNCVNEQQENALIQCLHEAHHVSDVTSLQRFSECLELLIAHGVNINGADADARTAVHWAVQLNLPSLLDVLVKKGASLDVEDRFGFKPLHLAIHCDVMDCVSVLARGCRGKVRRDYMYFIIMWLIIV